MKIRKLILLGVLFFGVACLVGMISCNSKTPEQKAQAALEKKGGMIVTMEVGMPEIEVGMPVEAVMPEIIDITATVLQNRLDMFGVKDAFVKVSDNNRIIASIPDVQDSERLHRLLMAPAKLEFWETYDLFEIKEYLQEVNDALDTTIFEFITFGSEGLQGPEIALCPVEDTMKINAILASETTKHILPRDVRFMWTAKPVSEGAPYYHLIALKTRPDGQAALYGDVITNAKVEHNNWSPEPVIDITMNEEGARLWQRLTRNNVGKTIGIVVDDKLYSYPRVMCEIDCGRSQIVGNYTDEEAADLANILQSGLLPCPVRIIDEQIIEPK